MTAGPGEPPAELAPRRRLLVALSAALACGEDARVEEAMDRAAEGVRSDALDRTEVEEALLQTYLFLGYPAALSALEAWRERVPEPPPETDPLAHPSGLRPWEARGEEVCRRVYGRAYRPLREKVVELHPAVDRWMVTEGYGKVLGRPGLPLIDRELCVAAILAVEGRAPQLHSHLRGALEAGAAPDAVEAALGLALGYGDGGRREAGAREVWERVRRRARRRGAEGGSGPSPPPARPDDA